MGRMISCRMIDSNVMYITVVAYWKKKFKFSQVTNSYIIFLFFQAANQATLNSLQRKFSRHGISLNVVAGYSALSARHVLGARGSDRSLLYDRRQVTTTQTMQFPTVSHLTKHL